MARKKEEEEKKSGKPVKGKTRKVQKAIKSDEPKGKEKKAVIKQKKTSRHALLPARATTKKVKRIIFKSPKKKDPSGGSKRTRVHPKSQPVKDEHTLKDMKSVKVQDRASERPHEDVARDIDKHKTELPEEKINDEVKEEQVQEALEQESADQKQRRTIKVDIPITVKELANKFGVKSNEFMKEMISKGIFATINQPLDEKLVNDIAGIFGVKVERLPSLEEEAFKSDADESGRKLVFRAPVVTLMGHVDHGKTSLLDAIRKTRVTEKEYGSITQHIGAYKVTLKKGTVTFLDTPGHEAFTAMRARGANATDVVVLVVAADDGIKPQTIEAIDHAKAAGVPIVVALNKCDLPHIDKERVKKQLSEYDLLAEDWGGKTIVCEVSAKTGEGVDHLLEMLLLESELLELKACQDSPARGVVIESELSRGRGSVATVLVQSGILHVGDIVITGYYYGRVKAMINDIGEQVKEVPPSMPVEISGLSGVPQAGEKFFVVESENKAKEYCTKKEIGEKERELTASKHISLAGLYKQIEKGQIKDLKVIIKGDVSGSIEALQQSLSELSMKYINIVIIHSGVGNVNDSDIVLAVASNAIVIGFHVKVEPKAMITAEREGVEVKLYNIIYEAIADIKAAMEGMLEPILKELLLGRAQVRQTFSVSKAGMIAGCFVVKGKIPRNAIVRLIRSSQVLYEGKISSLKRFKDDAKEALEGFECGISLNRFNNIKEGDFIEAFEIQKIARRLTDK